MADIEKIIAELAKQDNFLGYFADGKDMERLRAYENRKKALESELEEIKNRAEQLGFSCEYRINIENPIVNRCANVDDKGYTIIVDGISIHIREEGEMNGGYSLSDESCPMPMPSCRNLFTDEEIMKMSADLQIPAYTIGAEHNSYLVDGIMMPFPPTYQGEPSKLSNMMGEIGRKITFNGEEKYVTDPECFARALYAKIKQEPEF